MTTNYSHSRSLLTLALLLSFSVHQLTTIETSELCRQERRSEIICRLKGNSTVTIAFSAIGFSYVTISCSLLDSFEYIHLPRLNISNPLVSSLNCPLPPMVPINTIFRTLGITEMSGLIIKRGGPLQRLHFEGLPDINYLSLVANNLFNPPEDLFADLRNVKRLELKSNNLFNLPEALFAGQRNLKALNLSSNKIDLPLNIFSSLENLVSLDLSNNSLHNLPPGIFRNQKKITYLKLGSNNLINLTKESFEGGSSVKELDLSSNKIVALPPDVFSLLTELTNINLNENYLQSLPEGLFAMNKHLSAFQLYDNQAPLEQLPAKLLANLPYLREVGLSCSLETIPEDLFATSISLRNITISKNKLTELPPKLFADQIELTDLDLSRNQLRSLPDEIFRNNINLRVLRLSHNHLVNITNHIFSTLSRLQVLYVDNNNLFKIHPEAFANIRRLTEINMENNHLQLNEDPSGKVTPFHYLTELHTLNLKNNSIEVIFYDWKQFLSEFRMLDLSYNKITMVTHYDLLYLNPDRSMNLSHNSIQKVDFNKFDYGYPLTRNVVVDLSNNPVHCDCDLLGFAQFLQEQTGLTAFVKIISDELRCSYPKNLQGRIVSELRSKELLCPTGYELDSRKLCPDNCSCRWRNLRLIKVNCSNSNLAEIPLLPVLNLTPHPGIVLHIENNTLTKLPNASIPGYRHVVELHASNNRLIKFLASNLPKKLTILDLSQNKIQRLSDAVLSALNESRTTVAFAGNPWLCDCAAQSLLRFVQLNNKKIRDLDRMECVDGQKFQLFSLGIVCFIKQNLIIVVCILIIVLVLCTCIIAAYKYQQDIKVWLYARGMCLWLVTEEDLDKNKMYDAFISYSHRDEDFIKDYLLPELENGPTPFKLCIHNRDWAIGEFIPDQIARSVEDSRRTIIVLSPNFIESIWARMEFRAAHTVAVNEGRARVIVIIYGDIDNIDSLDPDLKVYLQMNTYVKWGDPWFWKKLRYAMPHPSKTLSRFVNSHSTSSIDNNLELSEQLPVTPPLSTP